MKQDFLNVAYAVYPYEMRIICEYQENTTSPNSC
jgi:hypothetical protein